MIIEAFEIMKDPFWEHHWCLGDRVHVVACEGANGLLAYWSSYIIDELGRTILADNGQSEDLKSAEMDGKARAIQLSIDAGLHGSPRSSERLPKPAAIKATKKNTIAPRRTGKARTN